MINVAVGWLLYERTGDPWSLGLVGVAELAPVLFFMVIAGNAADRYPRRNIGIFAHAVLTCAATGLALMSWSDGPTWAIYSLLAMVGTARAFASPSVNTILPQLLAPAEFANANAWLSSTFQLAAITGPAVGGMLIAATGTRDAVVRARRRRTAGVHPDAADDAGARAAAGDRAPQRERRVRRVQVRPPEPVVSVGDHPRSVRGVVRRRGRVAADLREGHSAGRPRRPRLAARRAGHRRVVDGADHDAHQTVGASRPRVVVGRRRVRRGDDRLRPVAHLSRCRSAACFSPASSTTSASSFA